MYNVPYILWYMCYPNPYKLMMQNDPGEKVDKGGVGSEECSDNSAVKDPENMEDEKRYDDTLITKYISIGTNL